MELTQYVALLCACIGVLVYLNSLDCGLCFDDERAIVQNRDLHSNSPWTNLLWNDFWGVPMASKDSHKSYRPLCVATFRLNYLWGELEPMSYHLVNILLHGVVCYLYVALVSLVCSAVWPALIAGLLFAVHPIHTEAVTGVVGRADVLAGVFYIAAILVYYKAVRAKVSSGSWLVLCVFLSTCSALSKETGITVVAVYLTMDTLIFQQLSLSNIVKLLSLQTEGKARYKALISRLVVMVCFALAFLYLRFTLMRGQPSFGYQLNPALYQESPYRQLHWAYLTSYHLTLLLSPSPLSPEYAMHTIPLITSLLDSRNLLTLGTFAAVGLFATIALWRRSGTLLFGLSLLVFPYVPASNLFFPVGFVVAERVLYLPSMGLCLLAAHGIWKLLNTSSKTIKIFTFIGLSFVLITQSCKTVQRNRDWKNEITLYSAGVRAFPRNAKIAHNLAVEYNKDPGLKDSALLLMELAVRAEPLYVTAISDLGYLHQLAGRDPLAEEMYQGGVALVHEALAGNKTISADVKNLKMFTRYSKLLRRQDRYHTAKELLKDIFNKLPPHTLNHNVIMELAQVLAVLNNTTEASKLISMVLAQDPGHARAHVATAMVHMKQGFRRQAERGLREAIKQYGYKSLLVYELASVLQASYHDNTDKLKEAEHLLIVLLQAEPSNVEAQYTLALVHSSLSHHQEATSVLLRVLEECPYHVPALYQLSVTYVRAGECGPARHTLSRLLEISPHHSRAKQLRDKCKDTV